jgi:hypothetical protein
LNQYRAKVCKNVIVALVFEKDANFFRRKLAKFAEKPITSTPDKNVRLQKDDVRAFTFSELLQDAFSTLLKFLYLPY